MIQPIKQDNKFIDFINKGFPFHAAVINTKSKITIVSQDSAMDTIFTQFEQASFNKSLKENIDFVAGLNGNLNVLKDVNTVYCFPLSQNKKNILTCLFTEKMLFVPDCLHLIGVSPLNIIRYLVIAINTLIVNYIDMEESVAANLGNDKNNAMFAPKIALFLSMQALEKFLSIESEMFASDDKKHIIQGCLQRIFQCFVCHSDSPHIVYATLTQVHDYYYKSSYNKARTYFEQKYLKQVLTDFAVKMNRISLTYCKYFFKHLEKNKQIDHDIFSFFPLHFHTELIYLVKEYTLRKVI